jgi:hypothetical protein
MGSAVFEFEPVRDIIWLMKRVGKIVICLASGLVFNTGLCVDNVVLPDNPYAPIVAHNIFRLNPPQAVDAAEAVPPPKITPNGIMTIFGTTQALFVVEGVNKPGQTGKNGSYILSEGQRQDDIEVTRIDEKSGVVTFNNHGVVQEIPLVKAPAITISSSPTPGAVPVIQSGGRSGRSSGRFGRNGSDNSSGTDNSSNLRSVPTRGAGGLIRQSQGASTADAQIVAMEVNRQLTADQVRAGTVPPLPPTPLTPSDAPGYIPMPPMPGQ